MITLKEILEEFDIISDKYNNDSGLMVHDYNIECREFISEKIKQILEEVRIEIPKNMIYSTYEVKGNSLEKHIQIQEQKIKEIIGEE